MKPIVALSIPTGIGASIGGYAGDFGYLAREFSKDFHAIVNPNAVNGGILSAINYDMSYKRVKKEIIETFNLNSQQAFERFFDEKIYKLLTIKEFKKPKYNIQKLIF